MKVNQTPVPNRHTLGTTQEAEKSKNTEKTSELKDKAQLRPTDVAGKSYMPATNVEISDEARLMQKANEAVHAVPDIRADRVADLKERVRAGTYKVDAKSVADRLVEEHFLTDLGKNNV